MTDTTLAPASAEASARPQVREIGIIMNGVSGRMGYRQHLVRSILAIRDQGGIELPDGTKVTVKPLLVGRSEAKLADLAAKHGIEDYTTDLDAALADPRWEIYADFLVTKARASALRKAIAAGKTIYTEKPTAETVDEALELAKLAQAAGVKTGVVHDKLYLPGPAEAQAPHRLRLLRPHPLGARRVRLLGVRGRLAARAAPQLELPRRGRRRHHRRHVPALELRAREPVRRGQVRLRAGRRSTSPTAGTRRASTTPPPPRTPPTASSSSRATSSRRSTRRGPCA